MCVFNYLLYLFYFDFESLRNIYIYCSDLICEYIRGESHACSQPMKNKRLKSHCFDIHGSNLKNQFQSKDDDGDRGRRQCESSMKWRERKQLYNYMVDRDEKGFLIGPVRLSRYRFFPRQYHFDSCRVEIKLVLDLRQIKRLTTSLCYTLIRFNLNLRFFFLV